MGLLSWLSKPGDARPSDRGEYQLVDRNMAVSEVSNASYHQSLATGSSSHDMVCYCESETRCGLELTVSRQERPNHT